MTFIEALYGSQYAEIDKNGKDGNKGRLNGNIFLSVFILLCIVLLFIFLTFLSKTFSQAATNAVVANFGNMSGRSIGKLLAIPLFLVIYFVITKTIGTEANFKAVIAKFLTYPEEIRDKANSKILMPFFIVLGLLILLIFLN